VTIAAAQPQQPQPAIGGQGIGHSAPAGISAGPQQALQQFTAPAMDKPLPQQPTHPATGGQGPTAAAVRIAAAQPQQPQPAIGGQGIGHTTPGGISAGPPQQPQRATGGPYDDDDDDEDDEDVHDPAAEESDWTEEQKAAWDRDVARVTRQHPPHKTRSPGPFWAQKTSYDWPGTMEARDDWVAQAVSHWTGRRSAELLENGPAEMSTRQLDIQRSMLQTCEPAYLITDVPEEECRTLSAYRGSVAGLSTEDRWALIKDLCQKHRGEVREIHGAWHHVSGPFPTEEKFFHAQYCTSKREAQQRTTWTGIKGKPASGGKGFKGQDFEKDNTFVAHDPNGNGHWQREATVTGLPELFSTFGFLATSRELDEWWGQARVLVHKRVHGESNPVRREAARRRYQETGRYGFSP
jgi:hypothetical protein